MEITRMKKGRKLFRLSSAAIFVAMFASGPLAFGQMSGNYTINKGSSASSSNFQSFTSAVQALQGLTRSDGGPSLGSGINGTVTFTVTQGSGPYSEQITIPSISGSSASNQIIFNGNGETIQFSGSSSDPHVIKLNGADYITLNDLYIKPTNSNYTWGVWLRNSSNNNTIKNCKIDVSASTTSSAYYSCGIAMVDGALSFTGYSSGGTKGQNNLFKDNEIWGGSNNSGLYAGIALNGTSSPTIDNNVLEGNYIHNFYYYGVFAYYYSGNTIYRNNSIIRGAKSSYTTFIGIYNYYCPAAKFYGNYIADDCPSSSYTYSTYAIYDYYGTTTLAGVNEFINNIINLNSGYYQMGIYSVEYYTTAKRWLHNTIYMRADQGYGYGIYSYEYNYTNIEIKNNIVDVNFNSYVSSFYNIYTYSYGNLAADGNVLPISNNSLHYTGYAYTINQGGNTAQTFTDWQGLSMNPDPNGSNIRPTYLNVSAGNFEPTSIDLDGAGVPAGVLTDQKGNSRSITNPDPGAIEFNIPINVTAINFPTSICQGATNPVEVTITNSSAINLSNFWVVYEIDGVVHSTEKFTNTISSSNSSNFTFALPVVSNNTGSFVLKAYVRGKAPVTSVNYTVSSAPVGSYITKGSNYTGQFNSGSSADPDIVAYGDRVDHVIQPPTGYTASDYGSV
ncbi:MAG: hypothetical protein GC180_06110, partial [Bacteroidetes bacterium]|nr:hypothetical protein [Bacteroidota bacterium]